MPRFLRRSNSLYTSRWGTNRQSSHQTARRCLQSRSPHLETLEERNLLAADLVISEFLARADDDGSTDWIELYNPTDTDIDLQGWHLTDDADALEKWQFPAVTIGAGDFLVVSASGLDDASDPSDLHTNFKLSTDGEYLALVCADGDTVSYDFGSSYPRQEPGVFLRDSVRLSRWPCRLFLKVPQQISMSRSTTR